MHNANTAAAFRGGCFTGPIGVIRQDYTDWPFSLKEYTSAPLTTQGCVCGRLKLPANSCPCRTHKRK
jgi:hypothetical protein